MNTICADCKHAHITIMDPWICLATRKIERQQLDYVTGQRRRSTFKTCREVNKGNCSMFEENKLGWLYMGNRLKR